MITIPVNYARVFHLDNAEATKQEQQNLNGLRMDVSKAVRYPWDTKRKILQASPMVVIKQLKVQQLKILQD